MALYRIRAEIGVAVTVRLGDTSSLGSASGCVHVIAVFQPRQRRGERHVGRPSADPASKTFCVHRYLYERMNVEGPSGALC